MDSGKEVTVNLIWATRGRGWGFRFLIDAGLQDPLPAYEHAFADLEDGPEAWHRTAAGVVALRFPDPLRRQDSSGRVIPHEFVLTGKLAAQVESVDDGLRLVWPLVAETYERLWDSDLPPPSPGSGSQGIY